MTYLPMALLQDPGAETVGAGDKFNAFGLWYLLYMDPYNADCFGAGYAPAAQNRAPHICP